MTDIKPGYTRVSEILKQWHKFQHIHPDVLKNKQELGTSVHQAIKADNDGIYMPISDKAEGYLESYMKWKAVYKPSYVEMENRYYDDKLKITGQIDAIVETNGERILIDFKTSAQPDHKTWPLQGTFYHMMVSHEMKNLYNTVFFMQLMKDGSMPTVHQYDSSKYISVCTSALITYRHFNS